MSCGGSPLVFVMLARHAGWLHARTDFRDTRSKHKTSHSLLQCACHTLHRRAQFVMTAQPTVLVRGQGVWSQTVLDAHPALLPPCAHTCSANLERPLPPIFTQALLFAGNWGWAAAEPSSSVPLMVRPTRSPQSGLAASTAVGRSTGSRTVPTPDGTTALGAHTRKTWASPALARSARATCCPTEVRFPQHA